MIRSLFHRLKWAFWATASKEVVEEDINDVFLSLVMGPLSTVALSFGAWAAWSSPTILAKPSAAFLAFFAVVFTAGWLVDGVGALYIYATERTSDLPLVTELPDGGQNHD